MEAAIEPRYDIKHPPPKCEGDSASPNDRTSAVPLAVDTALEDAELHRSLLENDASVLTPASGCSGNAAIHSGMGLAVFDERSGEIVASAALMSDPSTPEESTFTAAQNHKAAAAIPISQAGKAKGILSSTDVAGNEAEEAVFQVCALYLPWL